VRPHSTTHTPAVVGVRLHRNQPWCLPCRGQLGSAAISVDAAEASLAELQVATKHSVMSCQGTCDRSSQQDANWDTAEP
jgi:hypothetical protein